MRGFFDSQKLCGTCLRASTAVDSQNAIKWALHCLTIMAGYPVRHTPVFEELSPPQHDVTEGFISLAQARSDYHALSCIGVSRNLWVF